MTTTRLTASERRILSAFTKERNFSASRPFLRRASGLTTVGFNRVLRSLEDRILLARGEGAVIYFHLTYKGARALRGED